MEGTVPEIERSYPEPAAAVPRKSSSSTESFSNEKQQAAEVDTEAVLSHDEEGVESARLKRQALYRKLRPFILGGLAALILGWWISSIILKATRHRWYVFFNSTMNETIDIFRRVQDRADPLRLVLHPVHTPSSYSLVPLLNTVFQSHRLPFHSQLCSHKTSQRRLGSLYSRTLVQNSL